MPEKFDAVIVGAGPAGTTAALVLANAGFNVALFERAEEPGQKNVFGGVFHYSPIFNKLVPDFWDKAPVERYVTNYKTTLLAPESSVTLSYTDKSFARVPYNGFTLLRAKFDRWYAEMARESGAFLISDTTVEDLIWQGSQVVGIRTGRSKGEVYADTVIAADGVNSLIAKKAGLRGDFSPHHFSVAAKEIRSLPSHIIDERFCLTGSEGLAHVFVGTSTQGVEGGAFLYTNRSSLSLGVVAKLPALQIKKISVADLLEELKEIPYMKTATKGSYLKEYSGHLIPEGGVNMIPRLYGNGILVVGDAAGFVLSTGLTLQGMNLAVESGYFAAEAFMEAKKRNDFSEDSLSHYQTLLKKSFVLQDLETFRQMPGLLSNPRLYTLYPSLACGVAYRLYKTDGKPKQKMMKLFKMQAKGKISMWRIIKDIFQVWRALI